MSLPDHLLDPDDDLCEHGNDPRHCAECKAEAIDDRMEWDYEKEVLDL